MLEVVADRLAGSASRRHLLFLFASLFTLVFVGYHFGTFDQSIHISFLKKYADPSLYPGDPFFDLRFQHYSFFWFLFQPFYQAGVLEGVLLLVHLLATYLTYWMLWTLSFTLFRSPLAALLSTLAFAMPHLGFAGFPILEFSLLNRTFVLPFLLLAMVLYLRGRVVGAYALLGLFYNLHVISVQFVLCMFLLDSALRWRALGWRRLAAGLGLFVLGALPVLAWKLGSGGTPVDFSARPEWFATVARGTLYNLFYLLPPYPHILFMTFSGVSALLLFAIGRSEKPAGPHDRTVTRFVAAALIILVVQSATAQWYPATIIIQSQIIRAGLFILIFGYIYFGRYLAERYRRGPKDALDFKVLALTYGLFPLPVAPLLVWMFQRVIPPAWPRRLTVAATLATLVVAMAWVVVRFDIWRPGVYAFGPRTAWEDAQFWARDNTARDALFITPPQTWWLYQTDWRVFSERSSVATLSELLEAAFAPEYIDHWQPRFEAVAPGALAHFRGNYFENKAITRAAFYSLTTDQLVRLAGDYGADYLVVEKPNTRELPLVYENDGYAVYEFLDETSNSQEN